MFSAVSKKSIHYCKVIIRKCSRLTPTEASNPAILKLESSENNFPDRVTNALPPDKLQFSESNLDVVKKTFRYPQPDTGSSPPGIFANYIKKSPLLQELFQLGVNLHEVEKNNAATQFLLRCNFEDIREHIIFLKELSLDIPHIGYVLTRNPLLLKESIDDLNVRINYLKSKRFNNVMITRIIKENPFWLTHSTQQIDDLLGYFQKTFGFTGNEIRKLAVKNPKLITFSLWKIKLNTFALKEEIGFTTEELKTMILHKPNLLKQHKRPLEVVEFIHRTMNLPLERVVQEPEVLLCRKERLKSRHLFLEKLGKVQYDPRKPNYVALKTLVTGTDAEFCINTAKASVEMYNTFLKTL